MATAIPCTLLATDSGASPISLHLMAPRPAWGISGLHDEGTVETIEFFGGNRVVGVEGSLGGGWG